MALSKSLETAMSEAPSTDPHEPEKPAASAVPEGFKPRHFGEGFIGVNGPLYTRRTETGLQMGFRVEARHTNPMAICHGGMMASFCDMLLPISAQHIAKEARGRFCPTISLQIDYLAMAPLGAWVQGEAQVLRVARTMIFMQGLVTADGVNVARASGVFKIGGLFESFGAMPAPQAGQA
jgi:uncharacterized protein (TIGR00369 family)